MSIDPNTGMPIQPRSGGCGKAILTIGCLSVVLGAICCGGLTWLSVRSFQFNQDPVVAKATANEIAEAEFLNEFTPSGSMALDVPFVGKMFTLVFFEGPNDSAAFLGGVNPMLTQGQNAHELEAEFRKQITVQQNEKGSTQVSTKARELTIRGKPASFNFAHVKSKSDDNEPERDLWNVSGMFDGKNGPAFLMLVVPHADTTEDELAEKIESIQ